MWQCVQFLLELKTSAWRRGLRSQPAPLAQKQSVGWDLLTALLPLLSAGSAYYDNVRPLAYPDSDAVLICFDISRPETLDSVLKKVSPPCPLASERGALQHLMAHHGVPVP